MEKNKLRLATAFFLFMFSFTCIFAQDAADTGENEDKEAISEETEYDSPDLEEQGIKQIEAVPESNENEGYDNIKNDSSIFANLFWIFIIAGSFLLITAGLFLINYLSLRKFKKETKELNKNIDEILKNMEQKHDTIMNKPRHLSNTDDTANDIRDTIATLEKNISRLNNEISVLGDLRELKSKFDTLYSGKKITEGIKSGKIDVTEAFNLWAANPVGPLPEAFYYINGDIKIRTKREIKESAEETKWITNRNGTKKYLFPNPNSFNQMTNIPELYTMDQSKLKGRGQNKIKIITPCEMTKDGFVEFAGELELL